MKNIVVVIFTLLFVFTFSTELSYSQGVTKQPIALVEKSINSDIVKEEEKKII